MPRRGTTIFVPAPDAEKTIAELAAPQLVETADAIARAIPDAVPVNQGVVRSTYKTVVDEGTGADGSPIARVHVGSPFWHWLEYGTANNPPYRPVQNAVQGLGLRYEPK